MRVSPTSKKMTSGRSLSPPNPDVLTIAMLRASPTATESGRVKFDAGHAPERVAVEVALMTAEASVQVVDAEEPQLDMGLALRLAAAMFVLVVDTSLMNVSIS